MEQKLRRAVLDRLHMVGERAGTAETRNLVPMARAEIRRLTSGWRELLASHQPDDKGRCPLCSGWLRRRRWPCPVWLAAHHHLIGESLSNTRKAKAAAANLRKPAVVIPRRLPADHPANQPPAHPPADQTQPVVPAVAASAAGAPPAPNSRVPRSTVADRTPRRPTPWMHAAVGG